MLSSDGSPFLKISELVWPISARYHLRTPLGRTTHELHVDVPMLNGDLESSKLFAAPLWQACLATASTRGVRVDWIETIVWKQGPFPFISVPLLSRGQQFGSYAARRDSAVILLENSDTGFLKSKRIYLPCMPANWQHDGLLTDRGWDALMQQCFTMAMGASAYFAGGEVQMLSCWPRYRRPTVEDITGVAFLLVSDYRVCQYTDRFPDEGPTIWP